jgi:hypothetical protein
VTIRTSKVKANTCIRSGKKKLMPSKSCFSLLSYNEGIAFSATKFFQSISDQMLKLIYRYWDLSNKIQLSHWRILDKSQYTITSFKTKGFLSDTESILFIIKFSLKIGRMRKWNRERISTKSLGKKVKSLIEFFLICIEI